MIEKFKQTVDWYNNLGSEGKKTAVRFALYFAFGFLCYKAYNYVVDLKKINESYVDAQFAKFEQELLDCEEKDKVIKKLKRDVNNLDDEIDELKTSIILLKAASDKFPFPYWIKDTEGKMLYLNQAYVDKYLDGNGLNASDYIGKYDYEIWDKKIAESFRTNDGLIIDSNRPLTFVEVVNGKKLEVTKFPLYLSDYLYGIGGVEYQVFK